MVEKLRYCDLPYTNTFPLPTDVRGAARESKFQKTDSRAYLGSKTVQPMGGSSVIMYGIKSPAGRWSVSLCNCSEDTAHFHYGNVVLHISRDDLRDLGMAMQSIAEDAEHADTDNHLGLKKGLVQ